MSFIGVTIGHREVHGAQGEWAQLKAILGRHSRLFVLDLLGRISLYLDRSDWTRNETTQKQLVYAVFGEAGAPVWRAWEAASGGRQSRNVVFHEAQLVLLAKAALLYSPATTNAAPDSLVELGEALLIATDLINADHAGIVALGHESEEGQRAWQLYLLANSLYNREENFVHAMARSYDLYLTDKPQLHDNPDYTDLPRLAERATGIPVDLLWMGLVAVAARWMAGSPESILSGTVILNRSTYLSANFEFTSEEVEAIFSLMSKDHEALASIVEESFGPDAPGTFNPMPFARWPIAMFGDTGVPVSGRLLRGRLTAGLRYLLLDAEGSTRADRDRYLRYMGAVFEDYVHRLLMRSVGTGRSRYIPGTEIRAAASGRACDGLIIYRDAVVVLEVKGSMLPLPVRTGDDWATYQARINETVLGGAMQAFDTIRSIRSGELAALGILPRDVKRYFPLVVTLDDSVVNPLVGRMLRDELERRGVARAEDVAPFQVMDIGELEQVESALESGHTFLDIVRDKADAERGDERSFTNWWFERGSSIVNVPHNSHLAEIFHRIGNAAQATLVGRSRSTE